jgi:hypothetical protein
LFVSRRTSDAKEILSAGIARSDKTDDLPQTKLALRIHFVVQNRIFTRGTQAAIIAWNDDRFHVQVVLVTGGKYPSDQSASYDLKTFNYSVVTSAYAIIAELSERQLVMLLGPWLK